MKTLAIGVIEESAASGEVHAREMSYFSRMTDHQSFARLATVETHRRGVERAGRVCAVVDGAECQQKFIDLHRPDAVRIPDWCHGAEYLSKAGQAAFGAGTAEAGEWLGRQLHQLKHGEPEGLPENLRELCRELGDSGEGDGGALKIVQTSLGYLEKRRDQIRCAEFQAQGYPIGSGAVESANKLVVEARLKGPGMHWARAHVDPMLALRTVVCSDRWEDIWPQISQRLREKARERRLGRWVRSRGPAGLETRTDPRAQTGQRPPSAVKRPRKHARDIHTQNGQTLAQALTGYPRQTTLGAAWSSGEHTSPQIPPTNPTRKPDAHPDEVPPRKEGSSTPGDTPEHSPQIRRPRYHPVIQDRLRKKTLRRRCLPQPATGNRNPLLLPRQL